MSDIPYNCQLHIIILVILCFPGGIINRKANHPHRRRWNAACKGPLRGNSATATEGMAIWLR
jgi:hypothetical protein